MLNTEPININDDGAMETGKCLDKLIEMVNSEITGACMIPLKLPKKQMINIVSQAKEWFYKHYEDSVHDNYYILPHNVFLTNQFKKNRDIELPDARPDGSGRIFSVISFQPIGEQMIGLSGKSGFVDGDFGLERNLLSGMGMGGTSYSTQAGDSLMYYVVTLDFMDMARQILMPKIEYSYNRLSRILRIKGETPRNHVVIETLETIPDCALFNDEIFYRYVVAKTKKQIGTMIMTFGYSLPGRITLNGDMIRDDAQSELDAIITEIKENDGLEYFFTS